MDNISEPRFPIIRLAMSIRAYGYLDKIGIVYLEQCCTYSRAQLLQLTNKRTVDEVEELFNKYGLHFNSITTTMQKYLDDKGGSNE